jgi:two-component system, cell cycle response regulator DivK
MFWTGSWRRDCVRNLASARGMRSVAGSREQVLPLSEWCHRSPEPPLSTSVEGPTPSSESIVVAKRVLVVEDDVNHRDICVTILRHHSYEVVEAENGEEALRRVGECGPDLVLMDAMLPVMDGWEATALLKGSPATEHIPVVIFTALALEPDRKRSVDAGADGYIAKPCEPTRVVEEVRRLIGPPVPS